MSVEPEYINMPSQGADENVGGMSVKDIPDDVHSGAESLPSEEGSIFTGILPVSPEL